MWTDLLLYAVTAAYAVQSIIYLCSGNVALAIVVGGYTIANTGLILAAR